MNYVSLIVLIIMGLIIFGVIVFLLILEKKQESKFLKTVKQGLNSKKVQAQEVIDYDVYQMSIKEKFLYILIAGVGIFGIGYIFYHSFWIAGLLTPLAVLYPKMKVREMIKNRKNELNLQFKEAIYSIASSLSVGKSIEMAFKDCLRDLEILYPDPNTFIRKEINHIVRKIEMNQPIESVLNEFADRTHIEDIQNFADVFQICKRTGGNLIQVIKNTSDIINDKISIKQEIQTLISQRKFEQKVLNVLPLCMIFLISSTAPDFMSKMYTTVNGRIAMTVALGLFVAGYFISKKITDIEV